MVERLTVFMAGVLVLSSVDASESEKASIFEKEIRPILAASCDKCHSSRIRKGGLDLSSLAALRRGGESGEPLVAESLDDSLLWTMVESGHMPPETEPPLSPERKAQIRDWIVSAGHAGEAALAERPLTQHDVLPIFLLRCTTCHGARLREGDLDLRTRDAMLSGGSSGPALVPGDPANSRLIKRIESHACPPRERLLKAFVRRPSTSEVKTLRDWIASGARLGNIVPDIASTQHDPLVSDEDRQHWAFRPPLGQPQAKSIDDFILRRLHEVGLEFAPEADRDTLIRRAYLDLTGIPPSRTDWKRWHSHEDANWYRRMIEHLLESPRYGERWGRYWLDLAGYADSEGGVSADPIRQVAWKYRDYVVRAFNNDKPYDRFLMEQLAGDELLDYENASSVTAEMVENLVATGFLRMGIDQTGSRTMNFVPERLGVISDAITVVGEGLMGLTIGCARCHSHKYDPIPHRDYYRFKSIFQGALDEHDWLTFKNRTLDVAVPAARKRESETNPRLKAEIKQLESKRKAAVADWRLELLRQHYPEQEENDRQETLRALRIADNNRTQPQRVLVEMLQRVQLVPDAQQPDAVLEARGKVEDLEQTILQVTRQLEPPLAIRALWDRGEPSPTYVLRRGEHDKPGRLVGPGVPSVLTDGRTPFDVRPPFPNGTPKSGRRLALARWLTRPDHPLTARVIVNRVWYHHFGTGIVKSLENFGVQGDRPSHPELLDWLAVEFTERGWSIKELHRLIMNSRTYRQTSRVSDRRHRLDPQNRLVSRMQLRRMDAEALRDSLLFVSGKLDETPGGPPDPVAVNADGLVSVIPTPDDRWRRSIYLQYRRTAVPTMMETFDYPEMGPNCLARNVSTVAPQSLMLMNSQHVRDLAAAFAARVAALLGRNGGDTPARVETVYQLALNRLPTDRERQLGIAALNELQTTQQLEPLLALETYCHTIFNSAAFLYID